MIPIPFLDQLTVPLIIGFLWGAATWGWPVASVMLMPLFFPFYLVKFSVYGIPFTLVESLIFVSFFAHIIKQYVLGLRRHTPLWSRVRDFVRPRMKASLLWIPVMLLALSLVISLFVVPDRASQREVLGILKSWFVAPILYFYLVIHVLPGLKSVRRCLEWYTISALLLSIWGILQFVFDAYQTPDGRVSGPFMSANYLALYIMPAIIFIVLRLWHLLCIPKVHTGIVGMFMKVFRVEQRVSYPSLIRYFFAGSVILFALYLTRSFGAFLGLFVALFVYSIYHWFFSPWKMKTKGSYLKFSGFVVVLFVVLSLFFVTGDPGKFQQMFNIKSQSSSSVRLEVWKVSAELIGEDPVFGIGPGRFEREYLTRAPEILQKEPYEKEMLHPHNIFLMFWLSAGLLGLVSFLWLIAMLFSIVFRISTDDGRKRLGVICATMLLAILVHGLVDTPIWKNDLALQFWMIAGIIARLRYTA